MSNDLKYTQGMSHFVSVEVVLRLSVVGDQFKNILKSSDQE